jgi:large repetitive protein
MVRWRIVKKIFYSLIVLILSLVGNTAYGSDAVSALYQAHLSYSGHHARFPLLNGSFLNDENVAIAEFTFHGNARFEPSAFQVAVNGLRASVSSGEMGNYAQWQLRGGIDVLVVDIGRMKFDGVSFASRVSAMQKCGRPLRIWIASAVPANAAQLYFVRRSDWFATPVLSWLVSPSYVVTSAEPSFVFKSSDPAAKIECRIDSQAYSACQSPAKFVGLSNGWHTFRARVTAANGKQGQGLVYTFYAYYIPPAVEIVRTHPAQSPTSSRTLVADLKRNVNWGTGSFIQCKLDNGPYKTCVSPVTFSDLGRGDHTLWVRMAKKYFGILWVSRPDDYSWSVSQDAPVVEWVSTPSSLTNSDNARFEFKSATAVTFDCVMDGGSVQSCNSPWEISQLAEGVHSVSLTARDASGFASAPIDYQWQVDRTAPVLSFSSVMPQQDPTLLTRLVASYTSSEPATVTCSVDGTPLANCQSPLTVDNLAQGYHRLELSAVDIAGNVGSPISHEWLIDTTLPTLTVEMVSPTQLPTNLTSARFHFVPSETATFECSLDGEPARPCNADFAVSGLIDGEHVLEVTASDLAGNQGEPSTFRWVVDLTAPTISLVSATPSESVTSLSSLHLDFEVSDASPVTCELDSAGAAPCSSPFVVNGLADGLHQIVLRAVDGAGNASAPVKYAWQVASPAVANIYSYAPQQPLSNETSAVIYFNSAQSSVFECSLDSASFSACSSPANYTDLKDGSHLFQVRAINAANVPGPIAALSWTVNTVKPVVEFTSANPPEPVAATNELTLSFSSQTAVSFSCQLDGGAEQKCTSPMTWTGLSDGPHRVWVVGTDSLGNRSLPISYSWSVQATPLSVGGLAVQQIARTSAAIRWTTSIPASAYIEYGEGNFNTNSSEVSSDAPQSIVLTGLTANRTYQARVRVTDSSGRTAVSDPVTFTTLR